MSIQAEEVPDLVWDELVNNFKDSQERHVRGFVVTQSLKKLLKFTSPADIIELGATAHRTDKKESFVDSGMYGIRGLESYQNLVHRADLNFNKLQHGEIDVAAFTEFFESEHSIDDMAINSLTVRLDSRKLEKHMREIMTNALGLADPNYLKSPFFAKMESDDPATGGERRLVNKNNTDKFLKQSGTRVLRLTSMYSMRAQQNKQDPVMGVSPREIEDLAVNYLEGDTYGILYSKLFANKWRSVFGNSVSNKTPYELDGGDQWVPVEVTDTE